MSRSLNALGRATLGVALALSVLTAVPRGRPDAGADPGGRERRLRQVQDQQ